MNIEQIRAKIANIRESIIFDEPNHQYIVKGGKYTSVSHFKHQFEPEFMENIIVHHCVNKMLREDPNCGITKKALLAQWKLKRDVAANIGNYVHYNVEKYIAKTYLNKDVKDVHINFSILSKEDIDLAMSKTEITIYFVEDLLAKGYQIVDTETMLFDEESKVCGTVDLILYKEGEGVSIWDYKTNNKDIMSDGFSNRLLAPFSDYMATTFNKYNIQLNIYRAMFEAQIGVEVSDTYIIHITDECRSYVCDNLTSLISDELRAFKPVKEVHWNGYTRFYRQKDLDIIENSFKDE